MFFKKRKQRLLEKMTQGVDMVKMGTFRRLAKRYKSQYGNNAKTFAATVTNELFSSKSEKTKEFLDTHRREVEKEIAKLKNDHEVRKAVTQAVRVLATIAYAKGEPDLGIAAVDKLIKLQILVPGGDAPRYTDFLEMAGNYLVETEHYDI